MTAGVFKARRNRNGNVVVEVNIDGRVLTVPKQGRAEDAVLLAHDGKAVHITTSDTGAVIRIVCGSERLLGQDVVQPAVRQQPVRQQANTIRQPTARAATPPGVAGDVGGNLQTISQQRAQHALRQVRRWTENEANDQSALKSYVAGMPAMILMSGFGQTCAFYKSKGGNHEVVLQALQDGLGKGELIHFITQSSAQEYQLAEAEALEYLNWLKKFANAYLQEAD